VRSPRRREQGVTLVELVISLVLAGLIIGGLWSVWVTLAARGADPLVARQSLAVAQSLLREIELQPLPGGVAGASAPGRLGFASIADYHGLVLNGITDAEGQAIPGLESYRADIAVTAQGLNGIPAGQGWWLSVTVTGPDGKSLTLGSWRARR
jgi:MSHA pilin protein MshD